MGIGHPDWQQTPRGFSGRMIANGVTENVNAGATDTVTFAASTTEETLVVLVSVPAMSYVAVRSLTPNGLPGWQQDATAVLAITQVFYVPHLGGGVEVDLHNAAGVAADFTYWAHSYIGLKAQDLEGFQVSRQDSFVALAGGAASTPWSIPQCHLYPRVSVMATGTQAGRIELLSDCITPGAGLTTVTGTLGTFVAGAASLPFFHPPANGGRLRVVNTAGVAGNYTVHTRVHRV